MPSETTYRWELADSYRLRGSALWHLGKLPESETACRKSVTLCQGLSGEPAEFYREAQAFCKLSLAWVLVHGQRKHAEAEPILREILPFHDSRFRESPKNHWSLGVNCALLGVIAEAQARAAEAEELYRKYLDVGQKYLGWLDEHPRAAFAQYCSKPGVLFFLVNAHATLADFQERNGQLAEAEGGFREAKSICGELIKGHPNVPWYYDHFFGNHRRVASLARNAGRHEEVTELLREELECREKQVKYFPDRVEYRLELAQRYFDLGESTKDKEHIEKAVSVYDEAVRLDPKRADAFIAWARVHKSQGNWDKALATYDPMMWQ